MRLSIERTFTSQPSHGLATYGGSVHISMETEDTVTTVEYMTAFIAAAAAVDIMLDTDEPAPQETDATGGNQRTVSAPVIMVHSGDDPEEIAAAVATAISNGIKAVQLGDTPRPRLRSRIPGAI